MCGIAGIFNFKSGLPVKQKDLMLMCDIQKHRGPDDFGYHINGPLGLGHRRLSIIDLSTGHQPMANEDNSVYIIYNGEVYNYIELREMLKKKGHRFCTTSDTEVILKMYIEFGIGCLARLNGMFAFAIYDNSKKSLFIARDRVGIKPLYYALTNEGIIFASEMKALLTNPMVSCELNNRAVETYIALGYVVAPETMFSKIKKLQPGHYIICTQEGISIKEYWDIDFADSISKRTPEDYEEELLELLKKSMRLQLRSDVPVGVFLSGGIDSSTVAALLSKYKLMENQIQTFTVGYDYGFSEKNYARVVSNHFGTKHHEITVTGEMFEDFLRDFVWHMDEPVAEAPGISLYYLSFLAQKHVKVVLSGEGADELFGGYHIHSLMRNIEKWGRLIPLMKSPPFRYVGAMLVGEDRYKKFINLAGEPLQSRYLGVNLIDPFQRRRILSEDYLNSLNGWSVEEIFIELYKKCAHADIINQMLYIDMKTWLPDDILIKADKMSMAASIELRVPFLDNEIIDFSLRIPPVHKVRKHILKKAVGEVLPEKIISRKKAGFPTPVSEFIRNDLKDVLCDLLTSKDARESGLYDSDYLKKLVAEHLSGFKDHQRILWRLMILELWRRSYSKDYRLKDSLNQASTQSPKYAI